MKVIRLFETVAWTGKWICLCGILSMSSALYAGQYFQNFADFTAGATNFNDGSTLSSTAPGTVAGLVYLEDDPIGGSSFSELQLTESGSNDVQSAFELPDLDSGAPVYAFSVKWNSDIDGSFPTAGNGFSFNFGPLASFDLITNDVEETGYGVGLCLSVQTDAGTNSGFHLLANGVVIASLTNNPAVEWGANNTTRHFWEVDWNYYRGMSVRMDGQSIFTNVATTGFLPEGGDVFAWGARCNANTEELRLDNIVAITGGNLVQLPTSGPYYAIGGLAGYDGYSVTNAFDGTNSTYYESKGALESVGATVSPPNAVCVYALTSGESAGTTPHEWGLEGSTNGGALWNEFGGGGGYFVNSAETRAWFVTNSVSYGAYNVIYGGGAETVSSIGELRFYALSVAGAPYAAWTNDNVPSGEWSSVASSADGTKLAAIDSEEIFLSTNSGAKWVRPLPSPPEANFTSIASSSDGTKLAVCANNGGRIATNYVDPSNGDMTWNFSSAPAGNWLSIACSSNFTILAAVLQDNEIYVSTNSGYAWTATGSTQNWHRVTVSADGSTMAATVLGGGIYVSTNLGNIWTATSAPTNEWTDIASSADGTKLVAGNDAIGIYVSTNSGYTWAQTSASIHNPWTAVASSWDGTRLAASDSTGPFAIYLSMDSGNTWSNSFMPDSYILSFASSADGTKLVAGTDNEGIYTYGFTAPPSPSLKAILSGGYPVMSWNSTNGGNFVLQGNANLFSPNWSNVSLPVTVTTNGSTYQVTDLPTAGQKFYRLMAQ